MSTPIIPKKSLQDAISNAKTELNAKQIEFAYARATGMSKSAAHADTYGYMSSLRARKHDADTAKLVKLLKEESNTQVTASMSMTKEQRLEHLIETALIARKRYDDTGLANHGAVYLKAMSLINQMTGDNAATQVTHLVDVSSAQLNNMSHAERTQAYRRMMRGELQLSDSRSRVADVIRADDVVIGVASGGKSNGAVTDVGG